MPDEVDILNDHSHFHRLRPSITLVLQTAHFQKDLPGFDPNLILDSRHQHFTILHRLEETIRGNHIFRALHNHRHIVYAVDKKHRLILLQAFDNFKQYEKFLNDKKKILDMIESL